MIWLTWRQFRGQAVAAAAVLAAIAITLGATGPGIVTRFDQAGLSTCHARCGLLAADFVTGLKSGPYQVLFDAGLVLMYLVPALIGIFWGAPLIAREIETGTHRLAWNQSVSRTHWTVAKLALIGLVAIATAGLLSLMISWWASPIDHVLSLSGRISQSSFSRLSPLVFAARGVAPVGYAAFAFVLGVTAGVLIRRTLPAMAITLVVFAAVQVLVPNFVRPNLISPVRVTAPFNASSANEIAITSAQGSSNNAMTVLGSFSSPGAWILSNETVTPTGGLFTGPAIAACLGNSQQACNNWLTSLHLRQEVRYQPASRFWPFQWIETGLYLILATGLGWLCAWQVRRRRY